MYRYLREHIPFKVVFIFCFDGFEYSKIRIKFLILAQTQNSVLYIWMYDDKNSLEFFNICKTKQFWEDVNICFSYYQRKHNKVCIHKFCKYFTKTGLCTKQYETELLWRSNINRN